jgi:hypothetical protein
VLTDAQDNASFFDKDTPRRRAAHRRGRCTVLPSRSPPIRRGLVAPGCSRVSPAAWSPRRTHGLGGERRARGVPGQGYVPAPGRRRPARRLAPARRSRQRRTALYHPRARRTVSAPIPGGASSRERWD